MTLQTWKKTFKKANQRVDKAFANYLAFLETHVAIDENGEASPLDDGSILRMDWFAGRKSGWQIMCYASEECYQIGRYTKTGKLVTSGLKTARRLEERLENAIKNRNYSTRHIFPTIFRSTVTVGTTKTIYLTKSKARTRKPLFCAVSLAR